MRIHQIPVGICRTIITSNKPAGNARSIATVIGEKFGRYWVVIQVHGRESAELLNKVCGLDPAPLSFTELFAQAQRQAPQVATPARPAPAAATRPAPKVQPRPGRSGPRKGRGL